MSDGVYITYADYSFWLQWETDGEPGAILGESDFDESDFEKACTDETDDRWYIAATLDVAALKPDHRKQVGFSFDSRKDAERALKVAKAAKKRQGPLPEWAIKAQAAGWKAPKGWKP